MKADDLFFGSGANELHLGGLLAQGERVVQRGEPGAVDLDGRVAELLAGLLLGLADRACQQDPSVVRRQDMFQTLVPRTDSTDCSIHVKRENAPPA